MAAANLVFTRPPNSPNSPANLVFGDTDGPDIPDVTVGGGGKFAGFRFRVGAAAASTVAGGGKFAGFRFRLGAVYDVNVSRPIVGYTESRFQEAVKLRSVTETRYQQADPLQSPLEVHYQDASPLLSATESRWQSTLRLQSATESRYQEATRLPVRSLLSRYQETLRLGGTLATRFQEALRVSGVLSVGFQETLRLRSAVESRYQEALRLQRGVGSSNAMALRLSVALGSRYQEAWPPRPGLSPGNPLPPEPDPCYLPGLPANLIFKDPFDNSLPADLIFVCERHPPEPPTDTIVIPIRSVYIVQNNVSLTRVSDGKDIAAEEFSLSLDYSSWTWTFSASIDPRHFADVRRSNPASPVQLEATVNGHPVRVLVDDVGTERTYRDGTLRIAGRGISAVLSTLAPVNYSTLLTLTAQQHAAAILTDNGVPIGWDLDWDMADWQIPAGTWAARGRYSELLNIIAASAGGYIQPHDTEQVLRFLRKYPALPRDWGGVTPDFILPADAVEVEGVSYVDKPIYNGVYVAGQVNGILVPATVIGSDMTPLAQPVVDPLITHVDAGRGRAESILGDVGAQATMRLKTPVFPASGFIKPGAFVQYVDGSVEQIGLSRNLRVTANPSESWQTLELETHVE